MLQPRLSCRCETVLSCIQCPKHLKCGFHLMNRNPEIAVSTAHIPIPSTVNLHASLFARGDLAE